MKDLFFTMLPAALPKHKASLEFDAPPDMWKQPPEVFYQKVLKISQYSQENNCIGVSS